MSSTNININLNTNANSIRLRNWSIFVFIIYFILMVIVLVYDIPSYIISLFAKDNSEEFASAKIWLIFWMILVACVLIMNIFLYQQQGSNYNPGNIINIINTEFIVRFFQVIASILFIVFILWGIGTLITKFNSSDIGSKIIDILLIIGLLAIVYKILSITDLNKKPIVRIIFHTLLYIPCLLVSLIERIVREYKLTTKPIIILLLIEFLLLFLYLIYPKIVGKIYTQGGKQIINDPLPLNMENSISTYQDLNETYEHSYQYALSFWFYIDSASPSMNVNYSKFTNILSYGNNPSVKYNPSTNTLSITVSHDETQTISVVDLTHKLEDKITTASDEQIIGIKEKIKKVVDKVKHVPIITELDEVGRRVIYINKNVLLQKWNNIILNYNGGTLDIFYNGNLVKSAIEVVPYLTYDTLIAGEENGISGGIANITYFKEPLDVFKIKNLYNYMKNKNPPTLSNDDSIWSKMQ